MKCFVIMPFGEKKDPSGRVIDFDDIYEFLIKGAIQEDLKIECVRSDEIKEPGLIHRQMIESIFEADIAVVDVTTNNPNVYYELGVRHALKRYVTVVIRRADTKLPFNVRDLRVIEYDPAKMSSMVQCRKDIAEYVRKGLSNLNKDSLVHQYLDLRVGSPQAPILETKVHSFEVKDVPSKAAGIITGDIQNVKIVDIWVNSENTNMQMARFYDGSISGMIRYLGAKKAVNGNVVTDVIAKELARKMKTQKSVESGVVIATSSGELRKTHGVKQIFHAAAVEGVIGQGYSLAKNFHQCVRRALELADEPKEVNKNCSSILFPLFGAGTAKGDAASSFKKILETALAYWKGKKDSRIDRMYFLAYTPADLNICLTVMENSGGLTKLG